MPTIQSDDPNVITERIRGANGQTENLFVVEVYAGTDKFVIDASGNVIITGNLALTGTMAYTGEMAITGDTAGTITLKITGASGQTADLFVVEQNDGTDKFKIAASGNLTHTGDETITGDVTHVGEVHQTGATAGTITHRITGAPAQTADLLVVEQNDGTDVFKIDKDGYITKQFDPDAPSYIVWKSGSVYYAKNGATGAVDYSGSDAVAVLTSIIAAMPSTGGKVVIKGMLGPVSSGTITINKSNIVLEGYGYGAADSAPCGILRTDGTAFDLLTIEGSPGAHVNNIRIVGLTLSNGTTYHGTGNGHGIKVDHASYVEVSYCLINGFHGSAVYAAHVYGIEVYHCNIWYCGRPSDSMAAVHTVGAGAGHLCTYVNVHQNVFASTQGIGFKNGNNDVYVKFENNYMENYGAPEIECTSFISVNGAGDVIGNFMWNCAEDAVVAIGFFPRIINNQISETGHAGIFAQATTGAIIRGNTVLGAGTYGVVVGKRNLVEGNCIRGNTQSGISLGGVESRIIGNELAGNALDGLFPNAGIYVWGTAADNIIIGNEFWDDAGRKSVV